MQVRIFNIPLVGNEEQLEELNHFLAKHKVEEVTQQFFQSEGLWSFCVKYTGNLKHAADYKKDLSDEELVVFEQLREIRLALAREDNVPPYMIFHNRELAKIAQLSDLAETALLAIPGLSEKKIERYGTRMIELYNTGSLE